MVRETSLEAYTYIRDNGILSKMRWIVYDFIYHNGPCSMMDANMALNENKYSNGSFTSRFSELKHLGLIREVGKVKSIHTGRTEIVWDVTEALPPESGKILRFSKKKAEEFIKSQGLWDAYILQIEKK